MREGGFKAAIGSLARLLGLSVGGEGKIGSKTGTQSATRIVESSADRAVALLEAILASPDLTDLHDVRPGTPIPGLCRFRSLVRLKRTLTPATTERSIEVTGRSGDVQWVGLTSDENWTSRSLRNMLLSQSLRASIPAAGIALPIAEPEPTATGSRLVVQYLLIINPVIGRQRA